MSSSGNLDNGRIVTIESLINQLQTLIVFSVGTKSELMRVVDLYELDLANLELRVSNLQEQIELVSESAGFRLDKEVSLPVVAEEEEDPEPEPEPEPEPILELVLTADDDESEQEISIGGTLEIQLAETPGSGYHWDLVNPDTDFPLVNDEWIPLLPFPGFQAGIHHYYFTAVQVGTYTVDLRLYSPTGSTTDYFFVTIEVL